MRTWTDLSQLWISEGTSKSPLTRIEDLRTVRYWSSIIGELSFTELDAPALLQARSHLLSLPLAPSTINRRLSVLRAILRMAQSHGYLSPLLRIPSVPDRSRRLRWLTHSQFSKRVEIRRSDQTPIHLRACLPKSALL